MGLERQCSPCASQNGIFLVASDDELPEIKLNLCSMEERSGGVHIGYSFSPLAGIMGVHQNLHNEPERLPGLKACESPGTRKTDCDLRGLSWTVALEYYPACQVWFPVAAQEHFYSNVRLAQDILQLQL